MERLVEHRGVVESLVVELVERVSHPAFTTSLQHLGLLAPSQHPSTGESPSPEHTKRQGTLSLYIHTISPLVKSLSVSVFMLMINVLYLGSQESYGCVHFMVLFLRSPGDSNSPDELEVLPDSSSHSTSSSSDTSSSSGRRRGSSLPNMEALPDDQSAALRKVRQIFVCLS